jgi:hypothetical protein
MASTDQELKTLNKTVTDAVNILKMYVGSSAQMKAMTEKERELLEKQLNLVEEEKETDKKQRAFTERARDKHGKFIKKREGSWGKFLGMAESTFKVLDKVTFGVAGKFKNMVVGITSHFQRFFSEVKSQFLSLFGEESEWFAMIGAIKDSIVNSAKTMWNFLFGTTPKWAKKQIKLLQGMFDFQKKQAKLDKQVPLKKKKEGGLSLLSILGFALAGLAAGIGAWVSAKLKALELLMKFPALKKAMLGVKKFFIDKIQLFKKIPGVSKFMEFLSKFGKRFGKLSKAFKFGFKVLGWPLTILLGVIDFIKGFTSTEGDLFDKIKGGLIEAVTGFIELPVKFIGWIIEKVLGLFGVEVDGLGDKMMEKIRGFLDFLLDFNPFKPMWDFIDGFFSTEGTFLEKIKGGFNKMLDGFTDVYETWIKPIVDTVFPKVKNFFVSLFEGVTNWIAEKISKIPGMGWLMDKFSEGAMKKGEKPIPKDSWWSKLTGSEGAMKKGEKPKKEYYKQGKLSDGSWYAEPTTDPGEIMRIKKGLRAEEAALKRQKVEEEKANMAKMIEEGNKKKDENPPVLNKILAALVGNNKQRSDGGETQQQIPDELDNYLLGMGAYNGGFE